MAALMVAGGPRGGSGCVLWGYECRGLVGWVLGVGPGREGVKMVRECDPTQSHLGVITLWLLETGFA